MSPRRQLRQSSPAPPIKDEGKDSASPRSDTAQPDAVDERGRRLKREGEDSDEGAGEGADAGRSINGAGRKRKRSRKGLDKKYYCPHEGCDKSYSRAEHLYRHQLNREIAAALHEAM
jgi:hypothetical protein